MSKYISKYGLINAYPWETNAENSPLWTMQNISMSYNPVLVDNLGKFIKLCHIKDGLYWQNPDFKDPRNHDSYMSKDQLIAFVAYFNYMGMEEEIALIWTWLKRHLGTYDNHTSRTNLKRFMSEAIFFIGVLNGCKVFELPLKLYLKSACKKPKHDTSGKLKAFVMLSCLGMDFEKTYLECEEMIGNWYDVFNHYFNYDKEHPNIIEAKEVFCEN